MPVLHVMPIRRMNVMPSRQHWYDVEIARQGSRMCGLSDFVKGARVQHSFVER